MFWQAEMSNQIAATGIEKQRGITEERILHSPNAERDPMFIPEE